MKFIKVFLGVAVVSSLLMADGYIISTGSKKGNYFKYGLRLSKFVPGSKVITSKGSVENLQRLVDNKAQIAIAQKDAFRWFATKHSEAESIDLLGDLNKECVFVVAKDEGKISDDGDLQKDGVKVAVGKIGSGTQVTWDYMGSLEPGFKKATAIPKGGSRALGKVVSGEYDAAMFVLTPAKNNWLFNVVNKNKDLKFVPVTDWDLNDKLNGKPVYTFEKITTKPGLFGDSVKTICTTASVFINGEVDDDVADSISDALLTRKNYILKGGN